MKRLKVKWVPENYASIPLTEAVSHPITLNQLSTSRDIVSATPCARLIVISGSGELKADVTSVQQCAA